jgi:DNA modification methylase
LIFKKEFQHGGKKNINKLPSKLVEHLIKLTTKKGDVVCDLFAGSFIVPKTAEKLGRIGIGCEINPKCFFDTELTKLDLDEIKQTFSKAYKK